MEVNGKVLKERKPVTDGKPWNVTGRTGIVYNMRDKKDLLRLLEDNCWNASQSSRDIGASKHVVQNWVAKHGVKELVAAERKAFWAKQGVSQPSPTDKRRDRDEAARHRELLQRRKNASGENVEAAVERLGRDRIINALVDCFGVIKDAALALMLKEDVLFRIVARDEEFLEAARAGEAEFRLVMRDKMLLAAQGRLEMSRDQSAWIERLARWQKQEASGAGAGGGGRAPIGPMGHGAGGPPATAVKVPSGDELEVSELDLPSFSVPDSFLEDGGPELPN